MCAEKIWTYVTCGAYVYYVQRDEKTQQRNLYRVKPDNTGRELLREKTNIFDLYSVGDKLFCEAVNPTYKPENEWEGGQIDVYLLDEEGKHAKTLLNYWEDTEGNSGYGLINYGDKLMVMYSSIYGPRRVEFLYDPGAGARFPQAA